MTIPRVASDLDPLTYVVAAERSLYPGTFDLGTVLPGVLAAALVAALGLIVGPRAMRAPR